VGDLARESLRIGEVELRALEDGIFTTAAGNLLGDDSLRARIRGALQPVLAVTAEHIVLLDAGFGPEIPPGLKESYTLRRERSLPQSLREAGYEPEDVTHIVLSHLDPDHAGWALQERHFPNATVYLQRAALEEAAGMPAGHPRREVAASARHAAEEDWAVLLEGDVQIVPGVRVEVRPGHAAGHQIVWIESGGEAALFTGDLAPSNIFLNPDLISSADTDPEAARRNRAEILSEAERRRLPVFLYHEPTLAVARILRTEKGGFKGVPFEG
jgi:glyoxylase-like metal-dependent hydrolase (beta-lactamase superfamily II)